MEEKLLKLGRRALLCALCCGALCVGAGAKELDEADYYARSALSQRADAETVLLLYDQIGAGIEEMETQIDLGDGTVTVSGEQVRVAMEACQADHPEFFWLAGGYQHGASGTKGRVIPFYTMSEEEAAVAQKAFDAAAEVLLEGIDPEEMTELEMELAIHDRLVEAVTYEETDQSHNAYGAMVDGTAVCEGYTEAFQYLLAQVGIQSHKAVGRANGGPHAWNLVRIDGDYYYTDVTWDDAGDQLYYAYFNVTTAQLEEDHTIGGNEFDLPVCTATAANYFEVYGIKFSALNAEILGQMLRESGRGTMEVRVYADTEDPKEVWTWYQENIRAIAKAAGVTGRFSYGYSRSGREYKLQLEDPSATPVCPENAHVWDKGVTEKAATCTEKGSVKYTCTVCGEKKTEATDALGHAWDAGTLQGTEKVYTCERCKETKREDAFTQEEMAVLFAAEEAGLLKYLTVEEFGNISRLQIIKIAAALMNLDVEPIQESSFGDCANLTDEEKALVAAAVERGLLVGFNSDEFRPNGLLTRGAAALVLYRAMGYPYVPITKEYSDVSSDHPFYTEVTSLYNMGILPEDNGSFSLTKAAALFDVLQWAVEAKSWLESAGDLNYGKCGKNAVWNMDTDSGVLTISGSGAIYDYNFYNDNTDDRPWSAYTEQITSVVIEKGVTAIGCTAFKNLDSLTEVTIPEGMVRIGDSAFAGCDHLETVTLPASLETLETFALGNCPALKQIVLAEGSEHFKVVEDVLFNADMTKLIFYPAGKTVESYTVPEGVAEIDYYGFCGATNLKSIVLPDTLERIDKWAFGGLELTEITIPASVKVIDQGAFKGCRYLESVYFCADAPECGKGVFTNSSKNLTIYCPKAAAGWMDSEAYDGKENTWNGFRLTFWCPEENAHVWGEAVITKAATCTEDGLATYTCTVCGEKKSEIITTLGHDWDEGVEREGEIVYTCGRCGAVRTETKAEEEKKPAISGSISGHKVKEGTTVQLKKNGQVVSETDDAQEDFSFDGVDSGTYDLVVKEPGCLTYTVKNIVVDGTDLDLPEIEPVAGDFSGDDRINLTDLAAFRADFGKRDGELSNTTCDIDGDGRVNLTDLAVFRQNFGKTAERDCTVDYSA